MKTVLKKTIFIGGILFVVFAIVLFTTFFGIYVFSDKVKFDINKITNSVSFVQVYDSNNCKIKENETNQTFVKINTFPKYVTQCFVSIEDKKFYTHNGLDFKRMVGAMVKNIQNMGISQGASTISQQLIKNTHLSSQRTFTRKINEVLLTKDLEHSLSKNEIMEYYLNIIYFGDNCYGIESASQHYFSKPAKQLSLDEAATLAGIIKSPARYSPINNPDKCRQRRNLVLKEMYEDGNIDFNTYNTNCIKELSLNITPLASNQYNSYSQVCIDKASEILGLSQKQLAIGGYKIYSYQNPIKQQALEQSTQNIDYDYSAMSVNSKTGDVEAYVAKSNFKVLGIKRQPGSAIKPILVYSPALNENIVYPSTQINDEKIDINGFSPNNVGGKFSGYVTVRESVSKSLNIPAVKVLSYVGIDKAKCYAKDCGIEFNENDNNYSIALGGLTDGVTLHQLVGAYTALSNNGEYKKCNFISHITDQFGKLVYINPKQSKRVFRDDTAYIMTDMLKSVAKNGTARKLSDLEFDIASKTGTVGKTKNTDAYNISYTSEDLVGVWIGNADNSAIGNIVGGGKPTDVVKEYFSQIYSNHKPSEFTKPTSVQTEKIDSISLLNEHIVVKANSYTPEKYVLEELFSKFNLPKETSTNFINLEPVKLDATINNNKAVLSFNCHDYLTYEIYKIQDNKTSLMSVVSNLNGITNQTFDYAIGKKCSYYVISKIKNFADNTEVVSDKSNIVELYSNSNSSSKNKETSKWYL